jgi:hypothetical protein
LRRPLQSFHSQPAIAELWCITPSTRIVVSRYRLFLFVWAWSFVQVPAARAEAEPPPAVVERASDHAPRTYGVTVAGSYAFRSRLPLSQRGSTQRPWGLQLGARFGWQVGGLVSGRPSTVGFETDFALQPGNNDYRASYALLYGVFAKHALTRNPRVRPYFCYGLGAAQVWVAHVEGRGIGHATRLGFGLDLRAADRRHLTFALTYQGVILPSFALDGAPARDTSFHAAVLSAGFWHGN